MDLLSGAFGRVRTALIAVRSLLWRWILRRTAQLADRSDAQELAANAIPYRLELGADLLSRRTLQDPYRPNSGSERPAASRSDVVFVTARFRSGSTLLWNLTRSLPGVRAYYEPFNERRWFDSQVRGNHTDPTHVGVSDYAREYDDLEDLVGVYDERWIDRRLFMNERSTDPRMLRFIDRLIISADGPCVLQFNRVDFRLRWLRRHYPRCTIVHLHRDPRSQWLSSIGNADACPPDASFHTLGGKDFFYFRRWCRDLRIVLPLLDERLHEHPYELFYLLWRYSYSEGRSQSDLSFSYADLSSEPKSVLDPIAERTSSVFRPSGAAPIVQRVDDRWKEYADEHWFEDREARVTRMLANMAADPDP